LPNPWLIYYVMNKLKFHLIMMDRIFLAHFHAFHLFSSLLTTKINLCNLINFLFKCNNQNCRVCDINVMKYSTLKPSQLSIYALQIRIRVQRRCWPYTEKHHVVFWTMGFSKSVMIGWFDFNFDKLVQIGFSKSVYWLMEN